ncbi:hypothetical protein LF1_58360 [Rubripirellula obstinata]|uniref:Uncharacterized protein n=1 Tax=Rubripirellula obstinata TaxID=406547 RepID=A0A5B1CBI5_9BACT|nr:hypothetical protein LF1_58360 [Rubripirellula obstinata]
MTVTPRDEVRADRPHRNGALRITIACTGVAAAHFSLCLHVKSRHLGDAYCYPTEIVRRYASTRSQMIRKTISATVTKPDLAAHRYLGIAGVYAWMTVL